jgi:hypothetical protein
MCVAELVTRTGLTGHRNAMAAISKIDLHPRKNIDVQCF